MQNARTYSFTCVCLWAYTYVQTHIREAMRKERDSNWKPLRITCKRGRMVRARACVCFLFKNDAAACKVYNVDIYISTKNCFWNIFTVPPRREQLNQTAPSIFPHVSLIALFIGDLFQNHPRRCINKHNTKLMILINHNFYLSHNNN